MRLICVVLKDNIYHYEDTKTLLDFAFDNFQKVPLSSYDSLESSQDTFGEVLKEQGLLPDAVQDTALLLPSVPEETVLCKPQIREDTLHMEYYYGDTLLLSTDAPASQAVADAWEQSQLSERQTEQASAVSDLEPEPVPASDTSRGASQSLKGFASDLAARFQELPSWKYPALLLLGAALIFYLVMLIIRIKRSRRRRRREKARKNAAKKD